jgi:hypothetical protein
MATLSPRSRRLARELEQAIQEARTRDVLALVNSYGLPRDQRLGICRELDQRAKIAAAADHNVELAFSAFDQAHIRTVADVWHAH